MNKIAIIMGILGLGFGILQAQLCLGTTTPYKTLVTTQHNRDQDSIAKSINNLTEIINNEINKTEKENNLKLYENIKNLREGEALSLLKRNFMSKIQIELQGVLNSVKGE